MMSQHSYSLICRTFAALLLAVVIWGQPLPEAGAATDTEELVTTSRFALEGFLTDPEELPIKDYLDRAKGVFIVPQMWKGGLILGAEGGSGVLLVKGSDGSWSPPAFYTMAAGSLGLQVGGQVSEMIFTLMSEEAVAAILSSEFKLGGELSIAMAHKGAGLEAGTSSNWSADIFAFSKGVGMFGGGSLEGAKIFSRTSWNQEYYGGTPTPKDIVIERRFANPHADKLRAALPR